MKQQRNGLLLRDCQRLVNQDRIVFACCMAALGHADAVITGLTRAYHTALDDVLKVIDPQPHSRIFGMTMMVAKGRTVFIADTTVHELPDTKTLADIATQAARTVERMGFTPRVALLSFGTFGSPPVAKAARIRDVALELDRRQFPPIAEYAALFGARTQVTIESVSVPRDCVDGFLGAYWARPEAYLDPAVRAGISSFTRCDTAAGLERLRADLTSGAWHARNGGLLERESLDLGYRLVVATLAQ